MQNKTPHIFHITNQHWMSKSFFYRYGCILHQKKNLINFGNIFGIATQKNSNFCFGHHSFSKKDLIEIRIIFLQIEATVFLQVQKISKNNNKNWYWENLPKSPIVLCRDNGPLRLKKIWWIWKDKAKPTLVNVKGSRARLT